MSTAQLDLAEDVALVTFAMLQTLDCNPEKTLPGGTQFHVSDGFPGFCDHAGRAGLALHRAVRQFHYVEWIDIVIDYAETVIGYALNHGIAADSATLAAQAATSRRQAVGAKLARRRPL
jgi:hypothetical protein